MSIGNRSAKVRPLDIRQPFRLPAHHRLEPDEWPQLATYRFCLPQTEPVDHLIASIPYRSNSDLGFEFCCMQFASVLGSHEAHRISLGRRRHVLVRCTETWLRCELRTACDSEPEGKAGVRSRRGVSRVEVAARDGAGVPIPAGHGRVPGRTCRIHSPCPGFRCKG